MGRYRTPTESNQYYLPKHTYLTCIHYALQYRDWVALLNTERDTRGAIRYDKDKIQITNDYDSTSETAIRMINMTDKVSKIDQCIELACDDREMEKWLRLGVCYGFTIYQLLDEGMPCGKNLYYKLRQRFYYELSKKI